MDSIQIDHFTKALFDLLDETFDSVKGYYLDRGTSLFDTLADISAVEASIPVGGKCATLAAQVKHIAFYLDVVEKSIRERSFSRVDWEKIWRTVDSVTPDEWSAIQTELRISYTRVLDLIQEMPDWPSDIQIGQAMALIVHTAYHLGEIRQALCTIKA